MCLSASARNAFAHDVPAACAENGLVTETDFNWPRRMQQQHRTGCRSLESETESDSHIRPHSMWSASASDARGTSLAFISDAPTATADTAPRSAVSERQRAPLSGRIGRSAQTTASH